MSGTNSYAFCANYSYIYDCLLGIQNLEENGDFSGDNELLKLIRILENDLLKKLFLLTVKTLTGIDGGDSTQTYLGGDFDDREFENTKFHVGYLLPVGDREDEILFGDFFDKDFLVSDYYMGLMDTSGTGYSATFKSILNLFGILCDREAEIADGNKVAIDAALIPVLDAFEVIQEYLSKTSFRPCTPTDDIFLNNTNGVYLQVAGSDGTKGIAKGLHLRWNLVGQLGANHIPKGTFDNEAGQLTGFNRANDFVHIFRTPYQNRVGISVDFENDKPIVDSGSKRWTYVVSQSINDKKITSRIRLTFRNSDLYNQLAISVRPEVNCFGFLKAYNDIIDVQVLDKKSFTASFDFRKPLTTGTARLKLEAWCIPNTDDETIEPLKVRKTVSLNAGTNITETLKADNIQLIRLKKSPDGYLKSFYAETYYDFLVTRVEADWTPVGNGFSLSLDNELVYNRLESPEYPVDNVWPQYNNGTRVRISNYKDKWETSRPLDPSLREMIADYMLLSRSNPRAMVQIKEENDESVSPEFEVSYVDLIGIQALDYHFARMFGFGHIDVLNEASDMTPFVYQLRYINRRDIDRTEIKNYRYTTLPVTKLDELLPEKPKVRPLQYGLPVNDSDVNTNFDEFGYASFEDMRAVNIGREPYPEELDPYVFFQDMDIVQNENLFEYPRPVFFGIEYRQENQSGFVKPEITTNNPIGIVYNAYDDDFPETGIPETVPVLDDPASLYIHFEKQPGIHVYAIYGINWFSRASVLSDLISTDQTIFPVKNLLTPPSDLTVQYIQKEEPILFTTSREQTWLSGRMAAFPGADVGLTRITFNWIDIYDVSKYHEGSAEELMKIVRPDKANVYFRSLLPLEIKGVISNIVSVANNPKCLRLFTGSYVLLDGTIVSPSISNNDFSKFSGSLLTTQEQQFKVVAIEQGGVGPEIIIEQVLETGAITDDQESGQYFAEKTYVSPEINSRFTMVENLSAPDNWESLKMDISLISFADPNDPVIEFFEDEEGGNITKYWIGGIVAEANVNPLFHTIQQEGDLPGCYKITFEAAAQLLPHPQINLPFDPLQPQKNAPGTLREAHVEWYKGWLRMTTVGDRPERKLMEVQAITYEESRLVLYAYDAGYIDDPIKTSAGPMDFILVNFHPGYRAYLFSEPSPDTFNDGNILPKGGENDRRTLMAILSADKRPGASGLFSSVSMPAVLLARNIEELLQLETPAITNLKVRPDETGKAALTFDVPVQLSNSGGSSRKPFGFMFYRTTATDVFGALYTPSTVVEILENLNNLTSDPFYNLRIYEMVNLIFDPGNALHFNVFEAEPQAYGFPVPNKEGLTVNGDSDLLRLSKYQTAIHATLLPLLEQVVIYDFIKNGVQTENALPVIKDVNGNLLTSYDPKFNPFPMVRRYIVNNDAYLRFTDYNLSGSSRSQYFYTGAEVDNQLLTGPLSLFSGPVSVLQTLPSDSPVISSFSLRPPSVLENLTTVTFRIASIPLVEQISKIRIYRSTEVSKSLSIQTMDIGPEVEVLPGVLSGYEVLDNFSDLTLIPFDKTMYYRFVGIRVIVNEFDEYEEVMSYASKVISVRLINTINPEVPVINYNQNFKMLSWMPTTQGGTYYLFKQNLRGNWERIHTVNPPNTSEKMEFDLSAFEMIDENEEKIYHRFKVRVQNSSGLMNLVDNEVTIGSEGIIS